MTKKNQMFEVDTEGYAQTVRRRGVSFVPLELLSNAWDTDATEVLVRIEPVPNSPSVILRVTDNHPEGFEDLRDTYTLYKYTKKRKDPNVRGRFNIGEKEVLVLCSEAKITSTKGSVIFDKDGSRRNSKEHRDAGTEFWGIMKMTRDEMEKTIKVLRSAIPPDGVVTLVNGKTLRQPKPLASFEVTLPTELEDEEGNLRPTRRKTTVNVYDPGAYNPDATIYEMGIPVCTLPGDKWHIDVQQKVPLPRDRDSVTQAYLTKLRVAVVNHMHNQLTEEDSGEAWVREATGNKDIDENAFNDLLHKRHGDDLVSRSVDDPESNHTAQAAGYEVLTGRTLSKGEWDNAKEFESFQSAGKEFPTDGPKSGSADLGIPPNKWTKGMKQVMAFYTAVMPELIGAEAHIRIVRDKGNHFQAWYGGRRLTLNLQYLGHAFFNNFPHQNFVEVADLLIHELGHEYERDHLSKSYNDALTLLGAKLVKLALTNPGYFPEVK